MYEKIVNILLDYVEVPKEDITPETRFLADLKMNSLDIMTMVGEMEEIFDSTIETEDLNDIWTIQDLVDYISERTGE